jgi:hypothetical protein
MHCLYLHVPWSWSTLLKHILVEWEKKKREDISPRNTSWRPIGLRDVEHLTLSRLSVHRWRWGCQSHAPAELYSSEEFISAYHRGVSYTVHIDKTSNHTSLTKTWVFLLQSRVCGAENFLISNHVRFRLVFRHLVAVQTALDCSSGEFSGNTCAGFKG